MKFTQKINGNIQSVIDYEEYTIICQSCFHDKNVIYISIKEGEHYIEHDALSLDNKYICIKSTTNTYIIYIYITRNEDFLTVSFCKTMIIQKKCNKKKNNKNKKKKRQRDWEKNFNLEKALKSSLEDINPAAKRPVSMVKYRARPNWD